MTTAVRPREPDPYDGRLALGAPGLLRAFNEAGVLAPADVHVARRLAALGREQDQAVLLAAALAVRAPRLGHVCTDLATVAATVTSDLEELVDLAALPWPGAGWLEQVAASPLVAVAPGGPDDRPLCLNGTLLYLDRYWREERDVARDLLERSGAPAGDVDLDALGSGLDRLFDSDADDLQRLAAAVAVLRRLAVVAGGPGTGKTTIVARVVALLDAQAAAAGAPPPRVALAAPTGKAAARLEEAVHTEAVRMDVPTATRDRLLALQASTLHRLLGWRPGIRTRFRHHGGNRLPHDVVVVDETSMVSLSLMARTLEAVRPGARLVLVGDHEQLASVEAGAVLGDIVGPAAAGLRLGAATRGLLARAVGHDVAEGAGALDVGESPEGTHPRRDLGDGIVVLRRVHRFGGGIARLAAAVEAGDAAAAVAALEAGDDDVRWVEADVADPAALPRLAPVRAAAVAATRKVAAAAAAGEATAALQGLGALRLLCAHRRGPYGAATWAARVEAWLAEAIGGYGSGGRWYVGRPLLVTENDYGLRLYNGDTGVVVSSGEGRVRAVFERGAELLAVSPSRLVAVDTVHAMTVHRSQGSQFGEVVVLLPDERSPILTRELLYTAVTRAQRRLTLVGTRASVEAAVGRPVARASGLREALWG